MSAPITSPASSQMLERRFGIKTGALWVEVAVDSDILTLPAISRSHRARLDSWSSGLGDANVLRQPGGFRLQRRF